MPIGKDDSGALVVQFGAGDIAIFTGRHGMSFANELCFRQDSAGDVGRPVPKDDDGKTTAECGVQLRLQFNSLAAIQVFIEEAVALQRKMMDAIEICA